MKSIILFGIYITVGGLIGVFIDALEHHGFNFSDAIKSFSIERILKFVIVWFVVGSIFGYIKSFRQAKRNKA